MDLPLDGIRVLDFTRVLAGPFCTMQLADLGADVIKVEDPAGGDDARSIGPFIGGVSAYFASLNRNKRSLALNLNTEQGRAILTGLIPRCDVLVENFRRGRMDGWGLGYDTLSGVNSRLIYASVSGFGATGPDAGQPAYDIVVQARGGIMSITGPESGEPTRAGASIADINAGLYATSAILAALLTVARTGRGQWLDIAMLDAQIAVLENAIARYTVTGEVPGRIGNRHPSVAPFDSFPASDGHIIVALANERLWDRLCAAIGQPSLAQDPRFSTNQGRIEHWTALRAILYSIFQTQPSVHWLHILEQAGIPCAKIQDIPAVLSDPQVQARGMISKLELGPDNSLLVAASPFVFSGVRCGLMSPPPRLGEHSADILAAELGMDDGEIERLREHGVIGVAPSGGG